MAGTSRAPAIVDLVSDDDEEEDHTYYETSAVNVRQQYIHPINLLK
jgi:hypothetical protein